MYIVLRERIASEHRHRHTLYCTTFVLSSERQNRACTDGNKNNRITLSFCRSHYILIGDVTTTKRKYNRIKRHPPASIRQTASEPSRYNNILSLVNVTDSGSGVPAKTENDGNIFADDFLASRHSQG